MVGGLDRWVPAAVGVATASVALRVVPAFFGAGFVVGDGALFAVIATDIRNANFALPTHTTFNGGAIPLTYPPLGPYLLAAIPGDPVTSELVMVVLTSIVAVGLVGFIARSTIGNGQGAAVATVAFAVMPHAWLVLGGDAVRGLAHCFLLAATWRGVVLMHNPSLRSSLVVGAFAAGALLSHPSSFTLIPVIGLALLLSAPSLRLGVAIGTAALFAAAMVIPWLATAVGRHGAEPFLFAFGSHETAPLVVRALAFGITGLPPPDPVTMLGILGLAIAVLNRRLRFVAILFALILLTPGADLRTLSIPVALAAGVGWLWVADILGRRPGVAPPIVAVCLTAVAFAGAGWTITTSDGYDAVSVDDRAAAGWVRDYSRPSATIAVMTGDATRSLEEWAPALTGRVSLGTYQGHEWLPPDQWRQQLEWNIRLHECRSAHCLPPADLLFVSSKFEGAIGGLGNPIYEDGAAIYALTDAWRP